MKTYNSVFVVALVLLCISCAKPEIIENPTFVVPEGAIIGSFEKIETKASFSSNNSFLWSKDDALKVLTSKKCREFVLAAGAGKSIAYFVGSMGDEETLGKFLAYPYDAVKTLTSTQVEMTLPAQYTYTKSFVFGQESDSSVILPCYGEIVGTGFTVKHLGGYIIYEISDIPSTASKFVFSITNGKRINGIFSASLTASSVAFNQANASTKDEQTVQIDFPVGVASKQCFIIPVPQGSYSWTWDMFTQDDKLVGHGRQNTTSVGRGIIVGIREMCINATSPEYFENGIYLGQSIAVDGDWDGNASTPNSTLYWAPVNCGYEEKGTVNTDSDHRLGKLYQWGAGDSSLPYYYNGAKVVAREMYYDTTTPSPWYGDNVIKGTTSDKWNNNQGPCPEGWRLPTSQEFKILCAGKNGSYGWVSAGTYAGQSNMYEGAKFFGANADKTAGKGVFFPAAGYRSLDDGSAYRRGSYGYYWSSTPSPSNLSSAYYLYFDSSYLNPQGYDYYRAGCFSVRCITGDGDPSGEVHKPAVLTTAVVNKITSSSAICVGSITSEGDSPVIERGVCYSTAMAPTIKDSKVKDTGIGLGSFQCELSGLAAETKYYVRAYAINANGVYYGELQTFTTLPHYYIENGVNLGKGIAVLGDWNEDGTQTTLYWAPVNCGYEVAGSVNSDSDHRLGKLYQWGAGDSSLPYKYAGSPVVAREMYYDTATPSPWYGFSAIKGTTSDKWNNNQGPCPEGWRLPTSQEFKILCAGKKGSYGWVSAGTYAGQSNKYAGAEFFGANTDKTAGKGVFFPAAGSRSSDDGSAAGRGSNGYYWSSSASQSIPYSAEYLDFSSTGLDTQSYDFRANCFSVRCVLE